MIFVLKFKKPEAKMKWQFEIVSFKSNSNCVFDNLHPGRQIQ